ncbi:MAG: AbrB/MazE/SpoVT family DNA-binding domain-containing protein [Candidatus Hydrogenedentes bacterium]|nr:AbrB/MazE/SpoVT family DNA-binding domain-containing protein [Candidatus Hydrogenedentota bacterium]
MPTAHITRNGRIAVPKDVLESLHARAGDTVDIETEPDGSIRIYPKTLSVSDVAGILKTKVKSTVEEMDQAITEAFRTGKL